jgi:hypothetical protein
MRTTTHLLLATASALLLAGCGQKSIDFSGATPDVAGLTLEVQGGAAEGLPVAALAVGSQAAPAPLLAEVPADGDELSTLRGDIKALNGELRRIMERVEEAVQAAGTPAVGDRMIYGPADRCIVTDAAGACAASANFVLGVKHEREHLFTWLLEARPVGSIVQGDFKPVAAGWLARGGHQHRGVGRLALNLRNLNAVQPAYPGDGFLLAGFANGQGAKSVHYRLVQFTPDGLNPRTAAYVGMKNGAGVRRVRVATTQDLLASPVGTTPSEELLLARAAWLPGVAGRTWSIVTNWKPLDHTLVPPAINPMAPWHGDVPGTTPGASYFLGRACYAPASAGAPLTMRFKEWFLCDRPEAPAACLARQGGAGTVVTGSGAWSDAGNCQLAVEPPELADPGDDGDQPEHGSDEPGMGGAGMQPPPAPPSDASDVGAPPAGSAGMSPMM